VAYETQVLILTKGLERGVLTPDTFIELARNPPLPTVYTSLSEIVTQQLRLAKTLEALQGVATFSRIAVLAAMRFDTSVPLDKLERTSVNQAFSELDLIASKIVQKEYPNWALRDLAHYFRSFQEIVDTVVTRDRLQMVFFMTMAGLRSRRGGPANWYTPSMNLEDRAFFTALKAGGGGVMPF
jgi:hypothetical protein